MDRHLLDIQNLSVQVEEKEILHHISLQIQKGETHVLMGPNGAGKSTLGYTLMGHPRYQVTEGQIWLGLSVIIITTALQIPSAIFTESYLSFIGLGVSAPMPSLGSLANTARGGLQSYPLRLIFPALTICIIVLTLNLIGDGLRDAFDPKLSK